MLMAKTAPFCIIKPEHVNFLSNSPRLMPNDAELLPNDCRIVAESHYCDKNWRFNFTALLLVEALPCERHELVLVILLTPVHNYYDVFHPQNGRNVIANFVSGNSHELSYSFVSFFSPCRNFVMKDLGRWMVDISFVQYIACCSMSC